MLRLAFLLALLGFGTAALAQTSILELGTWVQRGAAAPLVLTIQPEGSGRKLTYKIRKPDGKLDPTFEMTLVTQLDGKDSPTVINGKPTNETMAIKRLDALHAVTSLRRQGKEYGTSKAELSADGKVMKVEDHMFGTEKKINYWDKK
jgi:hypothetical protein